VKNANFKDRVKIYIASGGGGNGCVSFRREKYVPRGGPDGGDGGRGGHVYLQAMHNVDSLLKLYYQPHQRAEPGRAGGSKKQHGRNGADLYIPVPCGTIAYDEDRRMLGEVLADQDTLLIATGGKGGLGNCHFASSTHQTPRESTPGEVGTEKILWLELRIMADAGLVGYPNAGKSTLLSHISHAHPKVAPYPFTTLNPVIGTMQFDDYKSIHIADIPGLIDGAHDGVGLGHDFLRHIQRTRLLLFVIDMAGVDGRKPHRDYLTLRHELQLYDEELDTRPFLVIANKMDLPEARAKLPVFIQETGVQPIELSAEAGKGLDLLKTMLYRQCFG
jgi:GTP-binding protein